MGTSSTSMRTFRSDEDGTEEILSYRVTTRSAAECISAAADGIEQGSGKTWFACLNPHAYVIASRDPLFSDALRSADFLVPDGIGVIVASRVLRKRIRARITGSDFFVGLMRRLSNDGGSSVFLLGSTAENLAAMREKIATEFPGVRVAGVFSPPFRDRFSSAESTQMIQAINRSGADALWVGMTAPKQEKWIYEHLPRLNVRFAGAVGAVFDYYTGHVRRPPAIFRRVGLEWLVRLLGEPRRLWKRNVLSAPLFFRDVFADRLHGSVDQRR